MHVSMYVELSAYTWTHTHTQTHTHTHSKFIYFMIFLFPPSYHTHTHLHTCHVQSIVSEACGFFQYAQHLFNSDSLAENLRFQHLHMYIHRIALSVILPPRSRTQDRKQLGLPTSPGEITTSQAQNTPPKMQTEKTAPSADRDLGEATPTKMATPTKVGAAGRPASRKLLKQATFAIGFSSANNGSGGGSSSNGGQDKPRPRSESLDLPSPSSSSLHSAEGKGAGHQLSGKSRRAQWTKQQSIRSDPSASIVAAGTGGGGSDAVDGLGGGEREWRGLNLTLLRSRIQRLIVVMNTSEPGSVPDAGMLASLVDLV